MLTALLVVGAVDVCLLVWLLLKLRVRSSKRTMAPAKANPAAKLYSHPKYPQAAQLYGPPEYPYHGTQQALQNTTVVDDSRLGLVSTVVAADLLSNTTASPTLEVIVEQPDVAQPQSDGFAGFGGGESSGSSAGSNDWNVDTPCRSDSGSSTPYDSSPSCNPPSYDSSLSFNPPS